jgi:hypothetical protein
VAYIYVEIAGQPAKMVTFDVVENEDEALDAEVTEHPVEKGSDITDHVRPKPETFRVEGLISNTLASNSKEAARIYNPYSSPPSFQLASPADNSRPGDDARATLKEIHAAGEPVELYLGDTETGRDYQNVVLQSISFPRDQHTGDALRFSAAFREVRIVSNQLVAIPDTKIPRAKGSIDRGTQPPKPTTDAEDGAAGSSLHQWFGSSATSAIAG